MKTIEQTRRELFEADFKLRRKSTFPEIELSRDSGSGYKYNPAHSDWMAWNAALDSICIELPKCSVSMFANSREAMGAMAGVEMSRTAIESTNLGLKII